MPRQVNTEMLSFAASRAYARKLKLLNDRAWREWCKSGKRPNNIPASPAMTYRDQGWVSWPDWLGYKGRYDNMLAFKPARAIVRKLKLKSTKEWKAWSKSGKRPSNIPGTRGQHRWCFARALILLNFFGLFGRAEEQQKAHTPDPAGRIAPGPCGGY